MWQQLRVKKIAAWNWRSIFLHDNLSHYILLTAMSLHLQLAQSITICLLSIHQSLSCSIKSHTKILVQQWEANILWQLRITSNIFAHMQGFTFMQLSFPEQISVYFTCFSYILVNDRFHWDKRTEALRISWLSPANSLYVPTSFISLSCFILFQVLRRILTIVQKVVIICAYGI